MVNRQAPSFPSSKNVVYRQATREFSNHSSDLKLVEKSDSDADDDVANCANRPANISLNFNQHI